VTGHPAESGPVLLAASGEALLARARESAGGHASQLLVGGEHQRVVLIALTAGSRLSEHESPPAATFQVVTGRARLYAVDGPGWDVVAGAVVVIPSVRHGVEALEDSVVLLTVTLG
jgi:quercetin dioxygenase-like cupin family protein